MPEDMKRSDDIDGSIIIASVIRMLYFRIIMLHGIMSIFIYRCPPARHERRVEVQRRVVNIIYIYIYIYNIIYII
jgi:hypothetical protein